MTIRKALAAAFLTIAMSLPTMAISLTDSLDYTVRLGYNIGGTAPIDMPASIRSMDKFYIQPNMLLGIDVQKDLWGRFGLMTGLHYETKSMKVDATVKNYHTTMTRGGQSIEGMYTGKLQTRCEQSMVTIPLLATYRAGKNVLIKLGLYGSYLLTRTFKGYVYDGYLREGTPTGAYIIIGNDENSRGTYDFSDKMRRLQWGIDAGVDWQFHRRWGVYADLSWGMNGINQSDFHTVEQTLYPIFGSVGLTYKLK